MRITKTLVDRLAHLSRLSLSEEEGQRAARDLEQILAYMDHLAALDLEQVEPMGHVAPLVNVTRPDRAAPSLSRDALLDGAPAAAVGTFLVPRAVE